MRATHKTPESARRDVLRCGRVGASESESGAEKVSRRGLRDLDWQKKGREADVKC